MITQSAIAFTQLLGAFSLIVTQFQSISSYTAVLARLSSLTEASERERKESLSSITFARDEQQIAYTGLTLRSPRSGRVLIKDLTLSIPYGKRILVLGHDKRARNALFRATAGLFEAGEGHIARPGLEQVLFLNELPFLPPGTLRELLLRPWPEEESTINLNLQVVQVQDEQILETLGRLNIKTLVMGFGGLDKRHHWANSLPLADQQLLVVARLLLAKPRFTLLDRPGSTLGPEQVDWILKMLHEHSISYLTFEESGDNRTLYDGVLELESGGAWTYKPVEADSRLQKAVPAQS